MAPERNREHSIRLQLSAWNVGFMRRLLYNDIALTDSSYRLEQGSYAVADLMAGYQVSKHLDLQLNANNIFDRVYYTAIGSSSVWGSTDTYGNPRSYALTAKYSF
ncbi:MULTISPECIES: TonB-dependent receptor domain-containing protein [Pseudomonas syringae group]|uniref:TonB-dependent receptor domain-containing protein n=1 Tax=Pseudomonas syringae group TaxID=136849 RepID=UPI0038513A21